MVAFAGWTLLYHLNLLLHLRTTPLLFLWAVSMAALGFGYVLLRRRSRGRWVPLPLWLADEPRGGRLARWQAGVAIALGVAAGVTAGLPRSAVPWAVPIALGLGAVVLTAGWLLSDRGRAAPPAAIGRGSILALLTGGGLAVLSLFTVNPDGDDAYFVSRSVWIAARGRIPNKDVIFTDQGVGHVAGEVPISSVEALNGALAHLFGLSGASVTWYGFLPVVTFGAVWAAWRLTREWAPRRATACLAVAVIYLLWSGTSTGSLGSFHLIRMWQGKGVFVSLLVPLLYAYLTVWAERRERRALALAAAAGVCAVGLTSTAIFLMPLVVAAAVVPLLVTRRVRVGLPACAAAAYPIAAGLVVALLAENSEVTGTFRTAAAAYALVLLTGVMGAISGCALWLGPWLARRGVPALIVAGIAGVTTVLLVPGVLEFIRGLIPADAVLWRVPWIAPIPVLVGLIAAVRLPRWRGVPGVALSAAIVVTGLPLWSAQNGTTLSSRPAWKADPGHLGTARAVLRANTGGGTVLAPFRIMRYVPLLTTTQHAAVPNLHYLRNLPADDTFIADRKLLSTLASRSAGPHPAAESVRAALGRVGVTYACVWASNTDGLRLLQAAGFGNEQRIDGLKCVSP